MKDKRMSCTRSIFAKVMGLIVLGLVLFLNPSNAYATNYTPQGPIAVPRIAQTHANDCNICSLASVQAFMLGQYSYTPTQNSDPVNGRPNHKGELLSRTYVAPADYSQNDDPVWWKLYIAYGCDNAPQYSSSLYPSPMKFLTGGVSLSKTMETAYAQLNRGVPVHIYTGSHASVIIGYRGNTNTLRAEDFTVMEIKPYGDGWKNNATYFNSYASYPSTQYSSKVEHCYVTLSAWLNGNGGSISVISYPTNDPPPAEGTLNINGYLDGVSSPFLGEYGNIDIRIGGTMYNGRNDYYASLTDGTAYKITRIEANPGYEYTGIRSGSLEGTISAGQDVEVSLGFVRQGTLLVQGNLDGIVDNSISGFGTFDVYINDGKGGEYTEQKCTSYNKQLPTGTRYEIRNIIPASGKNILDVEPSAYSGTIEANKQSKVTLAFSSDGTATTEWQEGRVLPGNLNPEELDVEYKYHYEQISESSPGAEWVNNGLTKSEYWNVGEQYSTQLPLATSDTRVFIKNYYYHWCSGSRPAYANYEYTSTYVHYDQVQAPEHFFNETGERQNDNGYLWVFLKWTNGSDLACRGGETCSEEHGYRNNRWYVGYIYQDRELHKFYNWTKDTDWVTTPQEGATNTTVRWRYKDGIPPIPPEEYVLTINGRLDGVQADHCLDYGCFDLYVDGVIVAEDCYGIEMTFDHDPFYSIENIRPALGKKFDGLYAGTFTGNMPSGIATVTLSFSTLMDITENWTETDSLPDDMDITGCDVEYKNRYIINGRTSPGTEWTLYEQGTVQYENDGATYTSPTELETSEERVQTGIFYYHWCGDPNEVNHSNWYQRPGVLDVYHTIFDVENYEVTSTNWDDGHSYHTFKNLNGPWAGGQTTCPDGCKYYYKGFIYQNKKPYQINTYIRESDWTNERDPQAASASVRVRRKLYDVYLNGNGGIPNVDLQKYYDLPLDLSEYIPEREDYIFAGWNTDVNGNGVSYSAESIYTDNASITLYAQWNQIPVTSLPDNLSIIEEEAFTGTNLKIVRVPYGCQRIYARAFAGCTDLSKIYIPASVTYIDGSAFDGIESLIIVGEENSIAELFAIKRNWITFETAY